MESKYNSLPAQYMERYISENKFNQHSEKALIAGAAGFAAMIVSPVVSVILLGECVRQISLANKSYKK